MLLSSRGLMAASLALTGCFVSAPVFAQDSDSASAPGPVTVSGSVTLVSDYRFRGISQTAGDPAIQGGITATHGSGFYVGTWASSIKGGDALGDMELDLFAGWSGTLSGPVGLDAGLLYYTYPTNMPGYKAEFFEPYATVSTTIGPVEGKLGVNYAWSQDALGNQDNLYLHSEVSTAIPQTPFTLSAHLGYTDGPLAPSLLAGGASRNGWDWSIGASATILGKLDLGVSYIGTDGPSVAGLTDNAVVGTVGVSF